MIADPKTLAFAQKPTARVPRMSQMAYSIAPTDYTPRLQRLERGVPFYRRGNPVTVVPRFKGLKIIAYNPASVLTSFAVTATTVNVTWPKAAK